DCYGQPLMLKYEYKLFDEEDKFLSLYENDRVGIETGEPTQKNERYYNK
ncbi:hypothetical protein A2U01_0072984, partial [Trifolium medium]|nr:hypothetical protein [Trifolium medium]